MKHKLTFFIFCIFLSILSLASSGFCQWVQISSLSPLARSFVSIGNNLFAGTENGLFVSTDFGESWNSLGFDKQTVQPLIVKGTTLYACYYEIKLQVFYSVDYGKNWTLDSVLSNEGIDFFIEKDTILFGTGGGIFRSTNNGTSWDSINVGINKIKRIISHDTVFTLPNFGLIGKTSSNIFVTSNAGMYKSNNNGDNWSLVDSGIIPDVINNATITSMATNDDNMFIGVLDGDLIYRWNDKDSTWIDINNHKPDLSGIESLASYQGNLFSGTGDGICISTDNGVNWQVKDEGFPSRPTIITFAFCGQFIFCSGYNTGVWRRPLSDFGISEVQPEPTSPNISLKNFPNPFTSQTTITFSNPERQFADIRIVDLLGAERAHIFSGGLDAGEHTYEWNATLATAGVYFCVVRTTGGVETIPILKE